MAHFARVNKENIVEQVLVVADEQEHRGQEFLANELSLGGTWVQTSYTSRRGKKIDPNTNEILEGQSHFRYNFAGIDFTWDENFGENGAFIPPRPEGMNSWVIDLNTADWIAPIPYPNDGKPYRWDEETISWVEVDSSSS